MPAVKHIKNGIVVIPDPKPQFKVLRDGSGNAIKVVTIYPKKDKKEG